MWDGMLYRLDFGYTWPADYKAVLFSMDHVKLCSYIWSPHKSLGSPYCEKKEKNCEQVDFDSSKEAYRCTECQPFIYKARDSNKHLFICVYLDD